MPRVTLLFYRDGDDFPVLDWFDSLDSPSQTRVRVRLQMLGDAGHEARRPLVENLGDGIYELRTRVGRVNYRVLFSFWGRTAVVLLHGLAKERQIPPDDLARARACKARFEADPVEHYAEMEV